MTMRVESAEYTSLENHQPAAVLQKPLLDPISLAAWIVAGIVASVVATWASVTEFRVIGLELPAAYLIGAAGIGLMFRRRGRVGPGVLLEVLSQFLLISIVCGLMILVLASTNHPYRDAELAAVDKFLFGIDWPAFSAGMTALRYSGLVLSIVYGAIEWQPFLLVFLLVSVGQFQRIRVFTLAWGISLAVVAAIFPLVPAVGAYVHYGIPNTQVPDVLVSVGWRHLEILQPLRRSANWDSGLLPAS